MTIVVAEKKEEADEATMKREQNDGRENKKRKE
jgi:hypothetical protein